MPPEKTSNYTELYSVSKLIVECISTTPSEGAFGSDQQKIFTHYSRYEDPCFHFEVKATSLREGDEELYQSAQSDNIVALPLLEEELSLCTGGCFFPSWTNLERLAT